MPKSFWFFPIKSEPKPFYLKFAVPRSGVRHRRVPRHKQDCIRRVGLKAGNGLSIRLKIKGHTYKSASIERDRQWRRSAHEPQRIFR